MRSCRVCGATAEPLADLSVEAPVPFPLEGKFEIVFCSKCQFLASENLNPESNSYTEYYTSYNKHHKRQGDAKRLDEEYFLRTLSEILPSDKDAAILDFGSGDLLLKEMLASMGYRNFHTFDIGQDLAADRKFALIISTHTFEHILDPSEQFARLCRHLTDDGEILLAVPDGERYNEYYCGPFAWFDLEHINHFNRFSLAAMFKRQGIRLKDIKCGAREVRPGLSYPEVSVLGTKGRHGSEISAPDPTKGGIRELTLRYLSLSAEKLNNHIEDFKKATMEFSTIYLWGIGIIAMRLAAQMPNEEFSLVDVDQRLWGKRVGKRVILPPDQVLDDPKTLIYVAAVNQEPIVEQLKKRFSSATIMAAPPHILKR